MFLVLFSVVPIVYEILVIENLTAIYETAIYKIIGTILPKKFNSSLNHFGFMNEIQDGHYIQRILVS